MAVKPVPDGYSTVTPYLITRDGARLLDFISTAFDGKPGHVMRDADGNVRHAELTIGNSPVMLGQGAGDPMPCMLHLYVPDVDAVYQRALDAGATSVQAPSNQFYGDRSGGVTDPVGNQWWIATRIEDVAPEEMKRREQEYLNKRQ